MFVAKIKSFSDRNLLNVCAFDRYGNLIDREYRKDDLTDVGLRLAKKEGAWLKSKGAKKNPPDIKLLEKALSET